jgi:hypothetical protein
MTADTLEASLAMAKLALFPAIPPPCMSWP